MSTTLFNRPSVIDDATRRKFLGILAAAGRPTMTTALEPTVADTARRQFIALMGAAGLLAACGDGGSAEPARQTRAVDHVQVVSSPPG